MRSQFAVRVLSAVASAALAAGVGVGVTSVSASAAPAAPAATSSATLATSVAPAAKTSADPRRAPVGALVSGSPVSRANTPKGQGKTAGYECTIGLPATKGGKHYLIIAGHCGTRGETVYTAWNNGRRTPIGKITGVSAKYDIAAVQTTRDIANSVWATRSGTDKRIRIKGVADAVPGEKVCQHGYRSGTVCGITPSPITSKQRAAGLVYGKSRAGVMGARPGDSGGLVLDQRGRAVGIVAESTDDGQWLAWVPTKLALKNWGMRAL